ncbi:MAG: hypothetical protein WAV20_17210, partial [Blastocatellia bacterium]
ELEGNEPLTWSSSGLLASARDNKVLLLNARCEVVAVFEGHSDRVLSLCWAPAGDLLASGSEDTTVRLWDSARQQPCGVLCGHQDHLLTQTWLPDNPVYDPKFEAENLIEQKVAGVFALAWSPDGKLVASASGDKTIRVWDTITRREVAQKGGSWDSEIGALDWWPGPSLASGHADGSVRLWDALGDRRESALLKKHNKKVTVLAWSRGGRQLLASGSFDPEHSGSDNLVCLWDPKTSTSKITLQGHTDSISHISWSASSRFLATASRDRTIRLWDVTDAGLASHADVPEGHIRDVSAVAWSPDGKVLASLGSDCIRIWDPHTGQLEHALKPDGGWFRAMAWSPDSRVLTAARDTGEIISWKTTNWRPRDSWVVGGPFNNSVEWSRGGETLAVGRIDGEIQLWREHKGEHECVARLAGHRMHVDRLAWSPYERYLASSSWDGTVRLWDVTLKRQFGLPLEQNAGKTCELAWSADGRLLASSGAGHNVRVWEQAELKCIFSVPMGPATALAWSSDNRFLALGADGIVWLWDTSSSRFVGSVRCLSRVKALQFSQDGSLLMVADDGSATSNRVIPYMFELCNFERGVDGSQTVNRRVLQQPFWRRIKSGGWLKR